MLAKSILLLITTVLIIFSSLVFADTVPLAVQSSLAALETSAHGRLGVYAINTANNAVLTYRGDERFPFCSTFKLMGVAAILKQSMTDPNLLQQRITYTNLQVKRNGYSPITEQHVTEGMTVSGLCAAAITHSDSTAINLLLAELGGPSALTAFARSIDDNNFRLDRWEPALNSAIPGDLRDTSTPAAMAQILQRLVLGNVLAPRQRAQLRAWLIANTTGNFRIRAGVPNGWIVGDKTGSGDYGTTNDIGIIWPPHYPPIVVAIYFTQYQQNAAYREDVLVNVTRIILKAFITTTHS